MEFRELLTGGYFQPYPEDKEDVVDAVLSGWATLIESVAERRGMPLVFRISENPSKTMAVRDALRLDSFGPVFVREFESVYRFMFPKHPPTGAQLMQDRDAILSLRVVSWPQVPQVIALGIINHITAKMIQEAENHPELPMEMNLEPLIRRTVGTWAPDLAPVPMTDPVDDIYDKVSAPAQRVVTNTPTPGT